MGKVVVEDKLHTADTSCRELPSTIVEEPGTLVNSGSLCPLAAHIQTEWPRCPSPTPWRVSGGLLLRYAMWMGLQQGDGLEWPLGWLLQGLGSS